MKHKSLPISLLFIGLCVCLGTSARAQLPDTFNGWESKLFRPINSAQLAEFAGNDAALIREYGFVAGEHREYAKDGKVLTVNLWKMKDATGGFGLYSFYRESGTASLEMHDPVASWPDRLVIQHGPYVVDARGAKLPAKDAPTLLAKIPPLHRSETLLPALPGFFPEEGLVPQSQKFTVGPLAFERVENDIPSSVIGFEAGAEAEIAQYKVQGVTARLLLVSYATPQLAAKKLHSLEQAALRAKDGSEIFSARKGPLVGFVVGAPASVAQNLLNEIGYEGQVTWNQYVPSRRDNIGDLVLNVFLLSGIVLLFAVVAGLSLGGARILLRKFLPGAAVRPPFPD